MMKRKFGIPVVICLIVALVGVGITLAFIVATSNRLENSFTIGEVEISLTETPNRTYLLVPGTDIDKDPTVTVEKGSQSSWIFFKMEKIADPDRYLTYEIADGWQQLGGYAGVYYRKASNAQSQLSFPILSQNKVSVKDTITEEVLNSIVEKPTLRFTAYAVQDESISTATEAYRIILSKEG